MLLVGLGCSVIVGATNSFSVYLVDNKVCCNCGGIEYNLGVYESNYAAKTAMRMLAIAYELNAMYMSIGDDSRQADFLDDLTDNQRRWAIGTFRFMDGEELLKEANFIVQGSYMKFYSDED